MADATLPKRPVISGFHPDPSVCRVRDRYWLATSSFEYAPGVPIFTSTDLLSWEVVGHALNRPDQLPIEGATASAGIYAPTLRHHADHFWLITTNVSGGAGQLIVTTDDPSARWSEPLFVPEAHGIDPDLTWDRDGTCWLSWSGPSPEGRHAILQAPLDTDTGRLLAEPAVLWFGTGGHHPEGPHLYEVDGHWYLLIAEGGTERGHMATVARGPSPNGPFEAAPVNPLITARSTDGPVQNTGHADLVQRPDGSWAVVFLGVRPHGWTSGWHVLGRETFAATIDWHAGWPRVGTAIEPETAALFTEELHDSLPLTWVAPSAWPQHVLQRSDDRWRLTGGDAHDTFVGRRQEHLRTCTQAVVTPLGGSRGGLEVRIDQWHRMTLWFDGATARAVVTIGDVTTLIGEAAVGLGTVLELRTEDPAGSPGAPGAGPDSVVAGLRVGDEFQELGRVDGRYFSTEVAGGFTGRMIGLVARDGDVHVESFIYRGHDE
ncbi:glycoside hydrolase family 43 protein [Arthrobacter burdickii]|uniref:Family 43 glycosylhydrolase n=1 Tax=Arthrobacter burdickii TaxID=3035920 RepID=A0ABT8JXI0_9MICC|nr:glycoside hydrolase family 43 protein [Arthrobacter burdickii]MDN4609873.1 family 43 glycosylhydrolase [Arthrobacter burdickii]